MLLMEKVQEWQYAFMSVIKKHWQMVDPDVSLDGI